MWAWVWIWRLAETILNYIFNEIPFIRGLGLDLGFGLGPLFNQILFIFDQFPFIWGLGLDLRPDWDHFESHFQLNLFDLGVWAWTKGLDWDPFSITFVSFLINFFSFGLWVRTWGLIGIAFQLHFHLNSFYLGPGPRPGV